MTNQAVVGIDASRVAVGQRTGTENYSLQITRALLSLDVPWEWRLYANAPAGNVPIDLPDGAMVRSIPTPRLWTHYRLSREMLVNRPSALFVPAHVVPIVHPPTIVTIHDLGYLHVPEAHPANQRRMLELTTRWSAKAARHVIAPSSRTRDDLIEHYRVPEDKVTVIHHGIDQRFLDTISPPTDDFRQKFGLSRHYVLAVGTIQPRKNLPLLARAMASATDEHDLVIAGKRGWMSDAVLAEIQESGIGERLRILDYIPDEDLATLYAGADLFVQPSAFEGFGMPVLEAMAVGTPVLSAAGSSLTEIAGDGAAFFNPGDEGSLASSICSLLLDSGARETLADRGRRWATRFTWERSAKKTRIIIENTLT